MIKRGKIERGSVYLLTGSEILELLEPRVAVVKDQLTIKDDDGIAVLGLANEKLVFYIANGVPAAAYAPWRTTAPPA